MKVVKSQVILFMHERLILEKIINPDEIKKKFELEDKTFYRYIQEIKAYYSNMYKKERVYYSRSDKKYYLIEL